MGGKSGDGGRRKEVTNVACMLRAHYRCYRCCPHPSPPQPFPTHYPSPNPTNTSPSRPPLTHHHPHPNPTNTSHPPPLTRHHLDLPRQHLRQHRPCRRHGHLLPCQYPPWVFTERHIRPVIANTKVLGSLSKPPFWQPFVGPGPRGLVAVEEVGAGEAEGVRGDLVGANL